MVSPAGYQWSPRHLIILRSDPIRGVWAEAAGQLSGTGTAARATSPSCLAQFFHHDHSDFGPRASISNFAGPTLPPPSTTNALLLSVRLRRRLLSVPLPLPRPPATPTTTTATTTTATTITITITITTTTTTTTNYYYYYYYCYYSYYYCDNNNDNYYPGCIPRRQEISKSAARELIGNRANMLLFPEITRK